MSVAELHVPIGKVDEMTPTVIDAAGERDVYKGAPFGALRLFKKLHPRFMWKSVALAGVAWDAGTHNVFPCSLTTAVTRKHMVDIQVASVEEISAVLASVPITLKHIQPCEFDFFFRETVKQGENDDSWDTDP